MRNRLQRDRASSEVANRFDHGADARGDVLGRRLAGRRWIEQGSKLSDAGLDLLDGRA